jgi:uncharacterized protein (DUF488 family)
VNPLYTIGYERSDTAAVVAELKRAGVERVLDVRAVPLSRKKGFSKKQLARTLEEAGIAYEGLTGLGTPKAGRDANRSGDLDTFERIFDKHMTTDAAQRDLARAVALTEEAVCCLLCFEADPMRCHRTIVARHLRERTGQTIIHLPAA